MKRCLGIVLLSVLPVAAADTFSGTWTITGDVSGNPVNEVCTMKQAETHVTGSCQGIEKKSYDLTGDVDGKKITFKHGGEYQGGDLTLTYSGTIDEKGVLKGTLDVAPYDASGDFTATKNP